MVQPQPPKSCRARSLGQPGQVAWRPRPPAPLPHRRTAGPTAQHNNAQKTSPVQRSRPEKAALGNRRCILPRALPRRSHRVASLRARTAGPPDRRTAGHQLHNTTTPRRPVQSREVGQRRRRCGIVAVGSGDTSEWAYRRSSPALCQLEPLFF